MRKILAVAAVGLALVGCAATDGLEPDVSTSGFDGARVVDIRKHGTACKSVFCTTIGAQWNSKTPDSAILRVGLANDYKPITGATLNIDGRVIELAPISPLTRFSHAGGVKDSERTFAISMRDVRSITSAGRAWLRVRTTDGAFEDSIVDSSADSKALHAIRRFLNAVDRSS